MKTTRSLTTIVRIAITLALLLISLGAGFAAAIPNVTILGTITENLRTPGKIALDGAGMMYVADTQNRGILKFDTTGRFKGRISVPGIVRSVACAAGGRLLVSHDSVVTIYDAAGVPQSNLTGYSFNLPNGIATDPAGNIYVVDSKANKVAIFNAAGQFTGAFGVAGAQAGQLNFPTGIAYEKVSNQVAVADTLNNRIQFFDAAGAFKRAVGTPTILAGPLCFTYPQGIAFDYSDGIRMYVVDTYQSSVQAIDLGGKPAFLTYIGGYGFADGQFAIPTDVAFDAQNQRLLVVDTSGLITLFGIDGGKTPYDPTLTGLSLNPVPAVVTTAGLAISGTNDPGTTVSVVAGSAAPVAGTVSGTVWNASINLQPGDNIITVTATGPAARTTAVSIAIVYVTGVTGASSGDSGLAGTAAVGGTSGSGTGGTALTVPGGVHGTSWSYPTGTDCRHSRTGGVVGR